MPDYLIKGVCSSVLSRHRAGRITLEIVPGLLGDPLRSEDTFLGRTLIMGLRRSGSSLLLLFSSSGSQFSYLYNEAVGNLVHSVTALTCTVSSISYTAAKLEGKEI